MYMGVTKSKEKIETREKEALSKCPVCGTHLLKQSKLFRVSIIRKVKRIRNAL